MLGNHNKVFFFLLTYQTHYHFGHQLTPLNFMLVFKVTVLL